MGGLTVGLDTSDAHKALDELAAKIRRTKALKGETDRQDIDPAKVAQAQKRYARRNGTH